MNATIQCLSQTEDLTNYFLDNKRRERIINNNIAIKNNNSLQLSPVYLSLLQELWNKNKYKGYVNPYKFMKTIEEMNSLFKLGQPGDSKDFIIFILEQFHRELKKGVNNTNTNNDIQINQYEQQTTLINFIEEFKKDTSIISDVFYGILETNNICLYCKQFYSRQGKNFPICYNYQIFNCIIFPLEKVKNFTKNKNNNNNNKKDFNKNNNNNNNKFNNKNNNKFNNNNNKQGNKNFEKKPFNKFNKFNNNNNNNKHNFNKNKPFNKDKKFNNFTKK
jgi:hypothetical protein